jgi:uncharacterized OB-fold protein
MGEREEWDRRTRCESCGRFFRPESDAQGELCTKCHESARWVA